ncbi:type IV secretory protein VirD4 [Caldanaerobacter subterraneus subsp. yonseiensis KB-1]|uniref:Type IV secretory protein VirD4 n=1 Tax=Caldanaerobacter subterraneus subsp. yonseiensis KB-1 TaxID=1388761 RepID=U5CRD0_CALSX|nr:helicase HerA-like domain-containing protein [Caldanaerobacter subterraneus]ERM92523.1 type IV secretory protein VirD4 [Caldanaerobacter subterraneus subsp. yonseiensis KB-1]
MNSRELTQTDKIVILVIGLVGALMFLPGIAFGLIIYAAANKLKAKKWLAYAVGGVITASIVFAVKDFNGLVLNYFVQVIGAYKAVFNSRIPHNLDWIVLIKVGISVGFILSLMIELYTAAQPEWVKKKKEMGKDKERNFNDGLVKKLEKLSQPDDGTLIGIDEDGNTVKITDEELNGHCLVLGATGAGKTTTLMNFIESAAKRKISVIVVDGKGEIGFAEKVKNMAEKYGRKFYLFSMTHEKSMHYNPLRVGNFTELKDKLISLSEWTEPHYKFLSERYLQSAIKILQKTSEKVDLVNISKRLNYNALLEEAKKLVREEKMDKDEYEAFYDMIDSAKKDIIGLVNRLAVFSESEIGELLSDTEDEGTIDLINCIEENSVVFFSLDALRFSEYSRLLGRLIVIDLKTTAARMFGSSKKIFAIFDEFGVFAGPQVTDFINKSRAAGFHVILSTQELADLRIEGKTELMEQILGNTNVKIIHRQDVPVSAELLSSLIGTKDDIIITMQVNDISPTGMGTVKEEKSFIVHPDEIKRLKRGEAFVVKKFPKFFVKKVRVRKV